MSYVAPVEDGKIVTNTTSTDKQSSLTSASGSTMDKDSFLQLLVAQMKYQDPMQPTSNTEYVAQFAQFSQVESLQNLSASMDLQRASSLVGKTVYVRTTNSTGESTYVYGKVDYVGYESGKAYMYINENRYPLDDLESIVDEDYYEAYNLATELLVGINKLPNVGAIDLSDGEAIDKLEKMYNEMTDYQKTFVAKEKADALQQYIEKIAELRKLAEEDGDTDGDTDGAGDVGDVGDAGDTDGAGDVGDTDGAGDAGDTDGAGDAGDTDGAGDAGDTDGAGDAGDAGNGDA